MSNYQNNSKRYIQQYMHELKTSFLPLHHSDRGYLKGLKKQLEEYLDENSIHSYEDLIQSFGNPHEVAANYYKNIDGDTFLKQLTFKKYLFRTCFLLLFFIFSITLYDHILLQKSIAYGESIEIQHLTLPTIYK